MSAFVRWGYAEGVERMDLSAFMLAPRTANGFYGFDSGRSNPWRFAIVRVCNGSAAATLHSKGGQVETVCGNTLEVYGRCAAFLMMG